MLLFVVVAAVLASTPSLALESDPFALDLAFTALRFSAAAYCSNSSIQDWNCVPCQDPRVSDFQTSAIVYCTSTETRGFIGYLQSKNMVVVSFEGTENIENWITDLEAAKVNFTYPGAPPGTEVHYGFYHAYMNVEEIVESTVKSLMTKYSSASLFVTGHSLGGALAAIASVALTTKFGYTVTHYTLGQPRVGNPLFADYFASTVATSYRFVHYHDIVPHVPPENLGFQHPPTEIWQTSKPYTNSSILRTCSSTNGEDPTCADSVSILDFSIPDHLWALGLPLGNKACGASLETQIEQMP